MQDREIEIVQMFEDTSKLLANRKASQLTNVAISFKQSADTVSKVEFWDWMNRNYNSANGHMFASNEAMQEYIAQGQGNADWMFKQLQGKGYEWDWMQQQRGSISNVFKRYDAGDVCNQPGFDVEEVDMLTGKINQYQMKAYTSKKNPDLHNTDKSIKVVTNAEKVEAVEKNGYSVESYKNRDEILSDTNDRMKQIKDGSATPTYTLKNVSGTMAKAGAIGCVVGMGIESVSSYKLWKEGKISDDEYLKEILKAGGDAGVTAGLSAGVMISVNAAITGIGASTVLGIPIAFVVSATLNKIVAPCFGRGAYRKNLGEAYYYNSLEKCYISFMEKIENASCEYVSFVDRFTKQDQIYKQIRVKEKYIDQQLKNLYDSI